MKKRFFILTFLSILVIPGFAQKKVKDYKSQTALATGLIMDLKKGLGNKAIVDLQTKVKTKGQFIAYVKDMTKKCKSCPLLKDFSTKLTTTRSAEIRGLHYGSNLVASAQNEEGTDPEPDTDSDEDDDRDTDGDEGGGSDCGPFHCLSRWGEHFPCQGVPGM